MSEVPRDENGRIASPCVRLCCLDDNDICLGCFRTVVEITRWGEATDTERESVLAAARTRRKHHLQRYPLAPH